jgi:hypothetical protein
MGGVLRDFRHRQGRTLRDVSKDARVSLGYLSEVERGQKEASSEMITSICEALETSLSEVLREVTNRVTLAELEAIPDSVPAGFMHGAIVSPHRVAPRPSHTPSGRPMVKPMNTAHSLTRKLPSRALAYSR